MGCFRKGKAKKFSLKIFVFEAFLLNPRELFEIQEIIRLDSIPIEVTSGQGFLKFVHNEELQVMKSGRTEPEYIFLCFLSLLKSKN